jgi:cytochrome oxidase Cu insertion factor (SCO1/SenC/PrrC family)
MFWKHHCSSCEYVTSFELSHRYGDKWDIYFHKYENNVEFVARFGDEAENYIADDNISNYDVNHPLGYYLTTSLSDFTASIRLLSTEEGGRRTPLLAAAAE